MKINLLSIVLFVHSLSSLKAQETAIGLWKDYLPYTNAIEVAEGGGKVYCANQSSLFSYNTADNTMERMTKITGLSDIGIRTIGYNKNANALIIGYNNSNLDLVKDNTIINIADIKRSNIAGNKSINSFFFVDEFAYLACGFGIVVLDMKKNEIKDTYFIGPNGNNIVVYEVSSNGSHLFAATENGIYSASLSSANLANFDAWTKFNDLPDPNGKYNSIVYFNNLILANLPGPAFNTDSIFSYDGTTWQYYNTGNTFQNHKMVSKNNRLILSHYDNVDVYDTFGNIINHIYSYFTDRPIRPKNATVDDDNNVWIADFEHGLVKNFNQSTFEVIHPKGPASANVHHITIEGNHLWVAPGGKDNSWGNIYNKDGLSSLIENEWKILNGSTHHALDTIFDILHISIHPQNSSQVYASSWSRGLIEITDNVITNIYTETNSSLLNVQGNPGVYRIASSAFDSDNNLWVSVSLVSDPIAVKKADGTWKSFNFPGIFNNNTAGNIIITQNNHKWLVMPRNQGILAFDDNGTIDDINDDKAIKLSNDIGSGGLPSKEVFCIAEDLDGEIWVGTDKGIAVFYNPGSVFGDDNFDAQKIKIIQDGNVEYLLETEAVSAIAVDGANRKWIGTQSGGVFLMSPDGTEQILVFNMDNSPLFSNTIISIAINHETGEVVFGTDKGIIVYKGTATEGLETFSQVYAYPNPVRENYEGIIAIKGLMRDADVKITDISGTLIYETTALGGQAIWNGKNFNGEKAHTGVYLVFCSNKDGSQTIVTKILFVN